MFIKNFSDIARPLHDITKKDIEFQWGAEQEQAFRRIYDLIIADPMLLLPNPGKLYEVETDVSDYAIGGQLG